MTGLKPNGDATPDADIVLTIIISCYNTRDLVRDCLQSIYQNPPTGPYEVILVDDASVDGTSEMARTTFPEVRLIQTIPTITMRIRITGRSTRRAGVTFSC